MPLDSSPIWLTSLPWPSYGQTPEPVRFHEEELAARLRRTRARMTERNLTHLLVYGDREHFGNLWWLTNFDPRFEEALLILGEDGPPLLLVGNECMAYVAISPLVAAGGLRIERYPPFSLANQPWEDFRVLEEILRGEGIGGRSRVGCAGWKSYGSRSTMDTPSYLVEAVRGLAGTVECATDLFIHPGHGLRARCGAAEIAFFERSNLKASEAMKRAVLSLRPGMRDSEVLAAAGYDGSPLSCHMTCKTGPKRISLASPREDVVEKGYPWSANIGYWGSNVCRAGWVAESAEDLPAAARDYVPAFVEPYFQAMICWFDALRIGTPGGAIEALIQEALPVEQFRIFLNPGHLIHGEEWLSSPIYRESTIPIASGMVMQSDVIPSSPVYGSTRMEDGYAIADEGLRSELRRHFPECAARCVARREFMEKKLGIPLPAEVLPLSNLCGMVMPFLLRPDLVLRATP